MNRLYLIAAILIFTLPSAHAQDREYKGGLNHTYIRKAPPPTAPEPPTSPATQTQEQEETPKSKVWKKYKALAYGTHEKEKNTETIKAEQSEQTPSSPKASQPEAESQKPTGIAAIIEEYKRNKNARSDMKTLRFSNPEPPTVDKPTPPEVTSPKAISENES